LAVTKIFVTKKLLPVGVLLPSIKNYLNNSQAQDAASEEIGKIRVI